MTERTNSEKFKITYGTWITHHIEMNKEMKIAKSAVK